MERYARSSISFPLLALLTSSSDASNAARATKKGVLFSPASLATTATTALVSTLKSKLNQNTSGTVRAVLLEMASSASRRAAYTH